MDYFTLETQKALDSLMEMTGMPQRGKQVNAKAIQEAVDKLKGQVMQAKLAPPGMQPAASSSERPPLTRPPATAAPQPAAPVPTQAAQPQAPAHTPKPPPASTKAPYVGARPNFKHVLIASQTGIITHQLRKAIGKLGGEVVIAQDVNAALAAYKNQDFGLVIVDLNMPTENEGMLVLDEIHRISVICRIKTDIVVLSPPTKDKHLKELCKNKGATIFLIKNDGWHNLVEEYYRGDIDITHFVDEG